ncbi:MAG: methyl-accepting chemotaxis protein [Thermodesulfovibrionales bacterium]|nr:methyl-accepting chemotaxis protein [Thermodesulfovibrionales bacterium]
MANKPPFRRRNYFINKKFQTNFSIKFLVVIVIEAIMALGLFLYLSKGTLTTGYIGSELKISRTYDFFLPMLLLSNIIIVGVTGIIGIAVLIFMSHRIAGPMFRFEKVLDEISKGDLTYKFKLRQGDQFKELEKRINELTGTLDSKTGNLKSGLTEISKMLSRLQTLASAHSTDKDFERLLQDISKKLIELQEAANYFKTSQDQQSRKP